MGGTRIIKIGPNQNGKAKKDEQKISFVSLIAHSATGPARRLLKKHGKADAKSYADLELKLSELYKEAEDKVALEKEIAEIHPHKDFILKYLAPKPEPTPAQENQVLSKMREAATAEPKSGCDGDCDCPCKKEKKSNACGCSSADGADQETSKGITIKTETALVFGTLGVLSIFAIAAMVINNKKG